MQKIAIAIHGGAGTINKKDMTPGLERAYCGALQESLDTGYHILEQGGTAVEAVKTAVLILEDNILFNAGRGSVFTYEGLHEMDAAIMDGRTLNAGAVTGVRNIKNPVVLAEQVMLYSGHVFLSGEGATEFARSRGLKTEPDDYFYSKYRFDQWNKIKSRNFYELENKMFTSNNFPKEEKFGTVGAVACDYSGNLAAATSTGGTANKRFGRIGDSPIIGAGTYANNRSCAISCTGYGEAFIKTVAAHNISCLMEYSNLSLKEASEKLILGKLAELNADGGLIGVDAKGNLALVFNTSGMYRAYRTSENEFSIDIYGN
jgi:L-asparaginase / beta-aspartyl-peptidase